MSVLAESIGVVLSGPANVLFSGGGLFVAFVASVLLQKWVEKIPTGAVDPVELPGIVDRLERLRHALASGPTRSDEDGVKAAGARNVLTLGSLDAANAKTYRTRVERKLERHYRARLIALGVLDEAP